MWDHTEAENLMSGNMYASIQNTKYALLSLAEFVEIYALFGRTKQTQNLCAEDQIQFLGLGGGVIFNPKSYVAYFGNFKQWFWAWNRYNTIISGLRVLSNGPTGPIKVLFGIHDICWTNGNWKNGVFSSGLVARRLYFWRKKDKTDKIPALQKLTHMLKFKVEAESRIFFKGGQLKNTLFISTNT